MAEQILKRKRTKRTKAQWSEIVLTLCKKRGYLLAQDLRPFVSTFKKHTFEVQPIRLVERGILFPGKFRPQRYYLTAEDAARAIAAKPPRKPVDFDKLPKCEVMQAPPSRAPQTYQNGNSTHVKIPESTRPNFTNDSQVTMLSAADMAAGRTGVKGGLLWKRALEVGYARMVLLSTTLDAISTVSPTVHNLQFDFHAPRLDASEFADIHSRNKGKCYNLNVNGIPVFCEVFPTGAVTVKARLTQTPIDPRDVSQLKDSIRAFLPFETPTTDRWVTTRTDVAYDIPTTSRIKGFTTKFPFKGRIIHSYGKKLYGRWYLRVEAHEYPHVRQAGYMDFVYAALERLVEVVGKRL